MFLMNLPDASEYINAVKNIERRVKEKINLSYRMKDGKIASHYLWNVNELRKIWIKPEIGRCRIEIDPDGYDLEVIDSFKDYVVRNIRKANFFTNSRINSKYNMSLYDIFTKRALRNIDILIDEIKTYPQIIQRALFLTLTAASGQMSSMVFAISGRGKTKNIVSDKIEVGSWVIGFWRPELHFEINVWNCFESRSNKLYKALTETNRNAYSVSKDIASVVYAKERVTIIQGDALKVLNEIPENSIKIIITDPPHSDRIPYLELSEIWNAILNKQVNFEDEIIVSNAKERKKNKDDYKRKMEILLSQASRVLKNDGLFLLYYNARDKQSWQFMETVKSKSDLIFIGAFPMEYSANSVVQDNRKGGMKTDYVLVMKNKGSINISEAEFSRIPGWLTTIPKIDEK